MRTDFENLKSGTYVLLHPNETNPLHKRPIRALFNDGYFYCDGSPAQEGPDYYFGDVLQFNHGYTI